MQRDASDTRVNPDLILKAIEKDEVADDARTSRGHLKIFFGYAAGAYHQPESIDIRLCEVR